MIIQKYKLNLVHGGEPVIVRASQYDNLTRVITFALFKDKDIFVVPDGCKVYVLGTKEDKTGYFYECTVERNYVAFYMRQQMTVLAGKHEAEIRIVDEEDHILNSANFIVDIEEAAFKDDTIISETDIPLLEEILEHIDAIYSVDNILQGGSEGQVLTKISNEDGDIEWHNLPTIPTKTSELENDSGFITKEVNDLTNYRSSANQDIIDSGKATTAQINNLQSQIDLKENTSNKVVSINASSTDVQYPSAKCVYDNIPTNVSQLNNDSGFITNAVDNLTNYRTSLAQDTIDSNKQSKITSSNKLSSDLVDDANQTNKFVSATDISNWNGKAEVSQIPTNVSQLNNDSGYLTLGTLPIYNGGVQ